MFVGIESLHSSDGRNYRPCLDVYGLYETCTKAPRCQQFRAKMLRQTEPGEGPPSSESETTPNLKTASYGEAVTLCIAQLSKKSNSPPCAQISTVRDNCDIVVDLSVPEELSPGRSPAVMHTALLPLFKGLKTRCPDESANGFEATGTLGVY